MSAIGTAAASATKTYFIVCIGLAGIGGAAMALSGSHWLAVTTGTGVGAGVVSADDGLDAFQKTMKKGASDDESAAETSPKK